MLSPGYISAEAAALSIPVFIGVGERDVAPKHYRLVLLQKTQKEPHKPVLLINPDGHLQNPLYHDVAIASGSKQVHIAGQVAWDADGHLVAEDLAGMSPAFSSRPRSPQWSTSATSSTS